MSPRLVQLVALLTMLAQLMAAASVGPGAAAFGHGPDHPAHAPTDAAAPTGGCSHCHPPHSPQPFQSLPSPHTHALWLPAAPVDLCGPIGWHDGVPSHCCECPHAHDHRGPQAPGSPRDGTSQLARPAPVAILAIAPPVLPPTRVRQGLIRHLEADHPPPVGLRTTRLLI